MQEQDNRKRQRFDIKYSVLCFQCKNYEGSEKVSDLPIRVEVKDISFGGLGISVNRKVEIGDRFVINLINGQEKMAFTVEVRWCKHGLDHYKAGCLFADLTKDKIMFLDALIRRTSILRLKS